MKKILILSVIFCFCAVACFGQGRSVSLRKKITEPYQTEQGVINVGSQIKIAMPMEGKEFAFVSLLNRLNEPISPAPIRMGGKMQKVKFFKEEDGVMYLFTEFFCVQIDLALQYKEIELIKEDE